MVKKRNGQYTEQVMVRLTVEDRANVRAEAKAEDRSEAWVIREAVRARYRSEAEVPAEAPHPALAPVRLLGGEKLLAHRVSACIPPCAIHGPSDHHMATWRQHWRGDRGIIERICPHGVGHPDPDGIYADGDTVHGCDGCCSPEPTARQRVAEAMTEMHRIADESGMDL